MNLRMNKLMNERLTVLILLPFVDKIDFLIHCKLKVHSNDMKMQIPEEELRAKDLWDYLGQNFLCKGMNPNLDELPKIKRSIWICERLERLRKGIQ